VIPPGFAGSAYLTYVSLLNQAVMMSTQLYNDATNPSHHKYAAHQVALLYVSLASLMILQPIIDNGSGCLQ
jgi:hypothetical protein